MALTCLKCATVSTFSFLNSNGSCQTIQLHTIFKRMILGTQANYSHCFWCRVLHAVVDTASLSQRWVNFKPQVSKQQRSFLFFVCLVRFFRFVYLITCQKVGGRGSTESQMNLDKVNSNLYIQLLCYLVVCI